MSDSSYSRGINALKLLRSLLDETSHVEVISEKAYQWVAHFSFQPPAQAEEIMPIKARWELPSSYEQFLLYSNGAFLYHEDIYGQWGFQLYGTHELLDKNMQWQGLYDDWVSSYLAFAESLGDSDILLLDTARISPLTKEGCVVDGDTGYSAPTWRVIAPSFGHWLDRLVVAQGAKYWRWY